MYNYPGSAPYGRPPPGFGGFPGAPAAPTPGMGAPPGFGAPPGMAAPGVAPGMQQADNMQQGPPGRLPPNFQPPANMPNINFNAPVIRLGTGGPPKPATPIGGDSGRREGGLDRPGRMGFGGQDRRGGMGEPATVPLVPPTKDEVLRTLFIGGIVEGSGGDDGIERILRAAGNLRRWTRATDADNKPCRFGFAEYEDPDSLATAIDVLKDVEVPIKPQLNANGSKNDDIAGDSKKEQETSRLLVFVDDATTDYLQAHQERRGDDPAQAEFRIDSAKKVLAGVLAELANPAAYAANTAVSVVTDGDGGLQMENGETNGDAEVVTIPLSIDDELSDIPAEMRETVAKEIAAFRERSIRRDLERLRQEEEIEAQDRIRRGGSPSTSGGTNAIPIGPRDKTLSNAPLGPKGLAGSQMPKDYQKDVTFVNSASTNGWIDREDEDTDADDEELERRRKSKRDEVHEKEYLNQERRWLNREKGRTAALERVTISEREAEQKLASTREKEARRLREFDDDAEAERRTHDYYRDHGQWVRSRQAVRQREARLDDQDRADEERDRERERSQHEQARGMADDFLNRQAMELDERARVQQEPQRFKLSLGAAAQKAQTQAQSRRTVAEVEGLLEDEEADDTKVKRTLIPIKIDPAEARAMSEEEQQRAAHNLVAEIPQDKEGLWNWPVKWDYVDDTIISEQLKPFVEKKIVELLGVQEQMLVEVVESHIKKRSGPAELVEQLEVALDVDAEVLVRKLWRMLIFYSESEKRGIAA